MNHQDARYEAAIARAHRQVWNAHTVAEERGWDGRAHDLTLLLAELERMQQDALRRGRALRTRPHSRA